MYRLDAPLTTVSIFVHMLGGAVITVLAPLQLIAPLRRRLPVLHKYSGYLLVG